MSDSEEERNRKCDAASEAMRVGIEPHVKRALDAIMEHCDSVIIFVTKNDPDTETTFNAAHGAGNYFSQYGVVRQWVIRQEHGFTVCKHE